MKIGILSFNNAYNYGGILQIYALNKKINEYCSSYVINYKSEFLDNLYRSPSLIKILNPRKLFNIVFRNSLQFYYKEGFDKFKVDNIQIDNKIYNKDNFKQVLNDFDKVIVGSDQVWSLTCNGNDLNYFLPYSGKCKKYSYAASLGVSQPSDSLNSIIEKHLSDFKTISVREKSGKKLLSEITNKSISVDCDPTLLLSKEEWHTLCQDRLIKDDYLLIYLLYEDKNLIKLAKNIAKKKNLKIFYINNRLFKTFGLKNMSKVSPENWVNLFYHASYIVTNSFHGIAFSINFNKQFQCSLLPHNNKSNVRIIDILSDYKLDDRIKEDSYLKQINFTNVNDILLENRRKSTEYLKKIIKD